MRTIVIGDVHGCFNELAALLQKVKWNEKKDKLVFVGDLVDKGPDPFGVLNWAFQIWKRSGNLICVKGNHEEKNARFWTNKKIQDKTGEMKLLDDALTAHPDEVMIRGWVNHMPLTYQIPDFDGVVVHGGFLPSMETLPVDPFEKFDSRALRTRFVSGRCKAVTQIKVTSNFAPQTLDELFKAVAGAPHGGLAHHLSGKETSSVLVNQKVTPQGSFLAMGQEGPDDPYWAEVYDGRFGHAFFGHEAFEKDDEPRQFPHATGLDTGCVLGGKLSAAIIEGGIHSASISVPAARVYCEKRGE